MSTPTSPLAYFITFTTYGTRLHGDDRGSVQRGSCGQERSVLLESRPELHSFNQSEMDQPPYCLDDGRRREIVLTTIQEVARHRGWRVLAVHVRTTHVHCVVQAEAPPERVMNDFKSYASRRLNEAQLDPPGRKRWVRHGSTLYLWTEESVWSTVVYTIDEQGDRMAWYVAPEFASASASLHRPDQLPRYPT